MRREVLGLFFRAGFWVTARRTPGKLRDSPRSGVQILKGLFSLLKSQKTLGLLCLCPGACNSGIWLPC